MSRRRGDRVALRFEILGDPLAGGMGTVYRARDHKQRRDVALKVIAGDGDRARFVREAALLAAVHHPGIVEYVAHGDDYLAMEWVEGETLAVRCRRSGVSPRSAIAIARQLASSLATLHAQQIVHRDVKPSNVMLDNERVVLVDLGIARHARAEGRITRTGRVVGSAGYMAPEQARGEREVDGRVDVFALGCIVYEMLTGRAAFSGDSVLALRAKVLLDDPPRLRVVAPDVPAALDELVGCMLSRDPAYRPAAEEVASALAEIEVHDGEARWVPRSAAATETSIGSEPTFAVLAAFDTVSPRAELGGMPVVVLDGGVVIASRSAAQAAAVARALAPLAVVALAAGASTGDAIDRAARLIDGVELARAGVGEAATGTWTDARTAELLPPGRAGEQVRLWRPT